MSFKRWQGDCDWIVTLCGGIPLRVESINVTTDEGEKGIQQVGSEEAQKQWRSFNRTLLFRKLWQCQVSHDRPWNENESQVTITNDFEAMDVKEGWRHDLLKKQYLQKLLKLTPQSILPDVNLINAGAGWAKINSLAKIAQKCLKNVNQEAWRVVESHLWYNSNILGKGVLVGFEWNSTFQSWWFKS